jgi:hypothetical protein
VSRLVVLLAALVLLLAPTPALAADVGLPFFGLFMHNHDTAAVARAAEAGAGTAMVEVHWRDLQPYLRADGGWEPGPTAALDARFANVARAGLRPVAVVGWAPFWAAASERGPLYPGKEAQYLAFVRRLVERYRAAPYGVRHWFLWPEPDAVRAPTKATERASWGDDGAALASLLRSASPAIKAVDPSALVVLGPLAHDWFDDPDGRSPGFNAGGIFRYRFLDDFMGAGGGAALDALAINTYAAFAPGWEAAGDGVDVAAKLAHVRGRLARYGVDLPIVVGEAGLWSAGESVPLSDGDGNVVGTLTPSAEAQARYVPKLFARARAAGAAAVSWFTLDDYDALATKYGLHEAGGAAKPAQAAYRFAAIELNGSPRPVGPESLAVLDGQVERYAFVSLLSWTGVAWATGSGSPRARVAVRGRAYDRAGAEVAPVGHHGDGRPIYELTDDPRYFVRPSYTTMVPMAAR